LRKVLAEADGVPMYAVFSNAQLAEMVTRQATSLTALAEINGVGTAKLDKYGKHFIAVLKTTLPTAEPSSTPDSTDETPPHHIG
jgi:superfamily II DNA helicase RecQ